MSLVAGPQCLGSFLLDHVSSGRPPMFGQLSTGSLSSEPHLYSWDVSTELNGLMNDTSLDKIKNERNVIWWIFITAQSTSSQWWNTRWSSTDVIYKRRPRRPPFLLVLSDGIGVTSSVNKTNSIRLQPLAECQCKHTASNIYRKWDTWKHQVFLNRTVPSNLPIIYHNPLSQI